MNALPRYVSDSTSLSGAHWRRSSRSGGANNCVEVAPLPTGSAAGLTAVRDSKRTAGPAVLFTPSAWEGFVNSLR
ncbi:DUF397 domain-containing protein [Streptomyces sp. VRA16 Mangrove soil]|uniref:DUF397 domain-containing protein n=1 Tax=Streptomyces sp. VRA16 Mangrove soil TaxID=2817434 RepID=UPI001A9D1703|nr:DUF397 domain-containing protein [Streptomyces sp. VRA16 Mangrove soil]MBO1332394.1 DUF397 domain-containing protein [Streptomyces sp. VRA16 Mangrove soil]